MDVIIFGSRSEFLKKKKSRLKENLEKTDVITTSKVEQALKLLESENFDVVVLDRCLPEMDLYNFFKKITEGNNPPKIILNCKEQEKSGIKTVKIDVDQCLPNHNSQNDEITDLVIDQENDSSEDYQEMLNSLLRHDLRNKIRLMQGDLQILKDMYELPGEVENRLTYIERKAKTSIDLIEKINTHSKTNEGKIEEIEVKEALEEALRSLKLPLEEKLNIEREGVDHCTVKASPLLKEVFFNIIDNAIKHSDGDKIKISTNETESGVICSIEDSGEGVPDDEKGKIFEKRYTTEDQTSTGLGLFLARKILELYGGDIKVKDSDLGGAKFEIKLKKVDK